MKKYLPYIALIIALGGITGWFIWNKTSGTSEVKEDAFAVKEREDITKIILTDTEHKQIILTKTKGIWMVNNQFEARKELIESVIDAATRMTILSPVPRSAHDNVLRELMAKNVKAEIFTDEANKPEKTYYVGGPTLDGQGTYLLLERGGKPLARPHIVYIPGFHGYVTHRFTTDEENWRSKVLFQYAESQIKSVSVHYPESEANSFAINKVSNDSFALSPTNEKFIIHDSYRQSFIRQYLGFFSSISIEAFDNQYSKRDSLIHTTPYCIITVTDADNSVNTARLFRMPISKRSKVQFDEKGNELTYDLEHYHAAINENKDLAIVQYYVFGKLLRRYPDFFFKPAS